MQERKDFTRVADTQYDPLPLVAEPFATASANELVPNCTRETRDDPTVVHDMTWAATRWFCFRCGWLGENFGLYADK